MTRPDQFESVFKSAVRDTFKREDVAIRHALLVLSLIHI